MGNLRLICMLKLLILSALFVKIDADSICNPTQNIIPPFWDCSGSIAKLDEDALQNVSKIVEYHLKV